MSIAFLDIINGQWRYRVVKPGYDARNLNLPPNAVVFDTAANEFLSVYTSGTLFIANGNSGQYKAVTWPDPGYVPFGWAAFKRNGSFDIPVLSVATQNYAPGAVSIVSDGLMVETQGLTYPAELDYIVFRASVP